MNFIRYFAFVWAGAAMIAGIWLGYFAWRSSSQPHAMLAVVLLLSAPMLAAAAMFARREDPSGDEVTSSGGCVSAIHGFDRSLRFVSLCRAHLGVACSYVFVLWFCELLLAIGIVTADHLDHYSSTPLPRLWALASVSLIVTATLMINWQMTQKARLRKSRIEDFARQIEGNS